MTELARGIDVNHYHRPQDWRAVFASGVSFVGLKATQGRTYVDPTFVDSRAACLAPDGAAAVLLYHFADAEPDPYKQADHFLEIVGELGPLELPVLDLERAAGALPFLGDAAATAEMFDRAGEWLDAVEESVGVRPLLYTRRVWIDCGNPTPDWALNTDLWIPRYRNLELGPGTLPTPWAPKRWAFWQWTDGTTPAHVTPGAGAVDSNVFNGTADELAAYCKASHG